MKQCKCCYCLHYNDVIRDEQGRCGKCQTFCSKDKLEHCKKVIEINRQLGELCVVDSKLTFGNDSNDNCDCGNENCEISNGCFSCYWSGFPCNSCLIELFKRNMSLSDVITTSMTYETFKKENLEITLGCT